MTMRMLDAVKKKLNVKDEQLLITMGILHTDRNDIRSM